MAEMVVGTRQRLLTYFAGDGAGDTSVKAPIALSTDIKDFVQKFYSKILNG